MTLTEFLSRFPHQTKVGDQVNVRCPAHEDRTASLTVGEGTDGRVLLHCQAGCGTDVILSCLGLTMRDLFPRDRFSSKKKHTETTAKTIAATYNYTDETGQLLYQAVRYVPKDFKQRRPAGSGWIWNLTGVERVLYRLPALRDQSLVYVVEGEKDADRLATLGLASTTNVGGADKWKLAYTCQLKRAGVRHVVIIPDNDQAGRDHAQAVATSCHTAGLRVQIVTLPDVAEKGDVSDYLEQHTRAELEAIGATRLPFRLWPSRMGTPPSRPRPSISSRSWIGWWALYRTTYTPLKSARNRDAQIVAHFLPHFGAKRLDEITKSDIVRYLNLRRTQMTGNPGHKKHRLVSESTVRRERGLLQSIFERAIDEGHDIRNPFRGIKRGKDKPRTRVLSLDEETKLLDSLHPRFQRFVRFALGTGCRLDEIRGIESKRDIDWTHGMVHVTGKFRKERDVPMQPDARAALEEQLEEEDKLWTQNPQRLREVPAEGTARAKVAPLTPHALRHTFGTRWLQAGGDIYKLSKILGHSSVAVTEQHYAHLLKEDLVAASQQVKIPVAPRRTGNVASS